MNVLYCGDSNVRDGVLVSVLSLLANQDAGLTVYVATAAYATPATTCRPIDGPFVRALDDLLRSERPGSGAVLVDATEQFRATPPVANAGTRFTPLCMLRLYADVMPRLQGVERVLYLDYDVLCHADVAPMYHQDMQGAEVCGVLDRYGRWFFHNEPKAFDYLNSGVLLMDMRRIRATGLFARCRELCATKRMFMPDQTAINRLATKKVVPRRFNEQGSLRRDTALQHFSTRFSPTGMVTVKPWQVERMHDELGQHAYDDVLDRYLELRREFIRDVPASIESKG